MQNKDWNIKEDPIFDKLNEITIGKLKQIDGGFSRQGQISNRKGKKLTEEMRRKISDGQRGEKSHLYGKPSAFKNVPMSEEQKEKIAKSHKDKPYAVYNGKIYSLTELTEELKFTNPFKLPKIKMGRDKNHWGITFL